MLAVLCWRGCREIGVRLVCSAFGFLLARRFRLRLNVGLLAGVGRAANCCFTPVSLFGLSPSADIELPDRRSACWHRRVLCLFERWPAARRYPRSAVPIRRREDPKYHADAAKAVIDAPTRSASHGTARFANGRIGTVAGKSLDESPRIVDPNDDMPGWRSRLNSLPVAKDRPTRCRPWSAIRSASALVRHDLGAHAAVDAQRERHVYEGPAGQVDGR